MCTLTVVLRGFSLITLIIDAFNARCSRFSKIIVLIPSSSSIFTYSHIHSLPPQSNDMHLGERQISSCNLKSSGVNGSVDGFLPMLALSKDKAVVDG